MNVLDRLVLVVDDDPVIYWRPRSLRPFLSTTLQRIERAGAPINLSHMGRRMRTMVRRAITLTAPEMEWLRQGRS